MGILSSTTVSTQPDEVDTQPDEVSTQPDDIKVETATMEIDSSDESDSLLALLKGPIGHVLDLDDSDLEAHDYTGDDHDGGRQHAGEQDVDDSDLEENDAATPKQLDGYVHMVDEKTVDGVAAIHAALQVTATCHRMLWDKFEVHTLASLIGCVDAVTVLSRSFYIGICRCPFIRFAEMKERSHRFSWQYMYVLCYGRTLLARWLERQLIAHVRSFPADAPCLKNKSAGGEKLSCNNNAFVYIVCTVDSTFADFDGRL